MQSVVFLVIYESCLFFRTSAQHALICGSLQVASCMYWQYVTVDVSVRLCAKKNLKLPVDPTVWGSQQIRHELN